GAERGAARVQGRLLRLRVVRETRARRRRQQRQVRGRRRAGQRGRGGPGGPGVRRGRRGERGLARGEEGGPPAGRQCRVLQPGQAEYHPGRRFRGGRSPGGRVRGGAGGERGLSRRDGDVERPVRGEVVHPGGL